MWQSHRTVSTSLFLSLPLSLCQSQATYKAVLALLIRIKSTGRQPSISNRLLYFNSSISSGTPHVYRCRVQWIHFTVCIFELLLQHMCNVFICEHVHLRATRDKSYKVSFGISPLTIRNNLRTVVREWMLGVVASVFISMAVLSIAAVSRESDSAKARACVCLDACLLSTTILHRHTQRRAHVFLEACLLYTMFSAQTQTHMHSHCRTRSPLPHHHLTWVSPKAAVVSTCPPETQTLNPKP